MTFFKKNFLYTLTCLKCTYQKQKLDKILLSGTGGYGLKSHIFCAVLVRNFWIDSNRNTTWTGLSKKKKNFYRIQGCFIELKDRNAAGSQKQLKINHQVSPCFILLLAAGQLHLSSSDKLFFRIKTEKECHQGLLNLYVFPLSKQSEPQL